MDEYFGQSAKKYQQLPDKYFSLFPALDRVIPTATKGQACIDLGCGTGDLVPFVEKKKYSYVGLDISADMLAQAKEKYPSAEFIQADATQPLPGIKNTFDVALCNMLTPSLADREDFFQVFKTAFSLLKDTGLLILTSGHPCYNGYMQKKLFTRQDIETDFKGYFNSGAQYIVNRNTPNGNFSFVDYHRTLTDYFEAAKQSEFYISMIDECPLTDDATPEIIEKMTQRGCPNYLVIALQKKS